MSYRTYVNGIQLFGNNECYGEWLGFIKDQGIPVDAEGGYEGSTTDFMGALEACEKITMRLHGEREKGQHTRPCRNLFDLPGIPEELDRQEGMGEGYRKSNESLFDKLYGMAENAYCFLPFTLFQACKALLIQDPTFTYPGHLRCYHVKPGCAIKVRAS